MNKAIRLMILALAIPVFAKDARDFRPEDYIFKPLHPIQPGLVTNRAPREFRFIRPPKKEVVVPQEPTPFVNRAVVHVAKETKKQLIVGDGPYPGWPDAKERVGSVREFFTRHYPTIQFRDIRVKNVWLGGADSKGRLGVTTVQVVRKAPEGYQPIRGEYGKDIEIEVFDGNQDTANHELAHSYSDQMREGIYCNKFWEEGQAEMISWMMNPPLARENRRSLDFVYAEATADFRKNVEKQFDIPIGGGLYGTAAFMCIQVWSVTGDVRSVRNLTQCHRPGDAVRTLRAELMAVGVSEDEFWKVVHRRAVEWSLHG